MLGGGLPLFTELPRTVILGNRASGVRNSRKPNLCHYSFLEALYIGVIPCAADCGYARMHEQLSGVRGSRKPAQPRSYSTKTVRCYPPPIGPATSGVHRASGDADSRKPARQQG